MSPCTFGHEQERRRIQVCSRLATARDHADLAASDKRFYLLWITISRPSLAPTRLQSDVFAARAP